MKINELVLRNRFVVEAGPVPPAHLLHLLHLRLLLLLLRHPLLHQQQKVQDYGIRLNKAQINFKQA
jgi:hypothetical protein